MTGLPTIPSKLEDWTLDILNELVMLRDIESDVFDFKGNKLNSLEAHICAMANTSGGTLVLGIDQDKDGTKILGFKKNGFDVGKEDEIEREVSNYRYLIEPTPIVSIRHITEGKKFYSVVKVETSEDRPYFTRNSGQCYVRIGSSSRPATRTMIIGLLTNKTVSTEEKRLHSERLCDVYRKLSVAGPQIQEDLKIIITAPSDYKAYKESILTLETLSESSVNYVEVSKIDYFDWAIEHLKHEDYSYVYSTWITANLQIGMYETIRKDLLSKFESLVKADFKKIYSEFSEGDGHAIFNDKIGSIEYGKMGRKQYFTEKLVYTLLDYLFRSAQGEELRFASLEKRPYGLDSHWVVILKGHQIMNLEDVQDINVEQLRKTLIQICSNKELHVLCKNMIDLLSKARKSIEEFSNHLELLIKDIEGGYLLKGKCKLQY